MRTINRPPEIPRRQPDADLEDEFICSLMRAAIAVAEGNTGAQAYLADALRLDLKLLQTPYAKAAYRVISEMVKRGDCPAPSLVRSQLIERFPDVPREYIAFVFRMSTGLISALPHFKSRIEQLASV